MRRRTSTFVAWARRASLSLPLLALPGPCTSFDDATPPVPPPLSGGDAGADAGGGAAGPGPYLSPTDAARACSLAVRCPTLPYSIGLSLAVPVPTTFAACVHTLASPVPPSRLGFALQQRVLRQVAAARECQAALDALPVELLYGDDPRCPRDGASACRDATTAVYCDKTSGYGTLSRCALSHADSSCSPLTIPDAGSYAVCARGTCPSFVPDAFCEGTVLQTCDARGSSLETTYDCAWLGLACGTGVDRYVTCVTPGADERCPSFGAATCAGDTVRYCAGTGDGHWSTFACDEVGATCAGGLLADGGGTLPFCLKRDHECSPLDPELGSCEGSSIALCVDGKRVMFDCAVAGKQCDPSLRSCL